MTGAFKLFLKCEFLSLLQFSALACHQNEGEGEGLGEEKGEGV